VADLLVTGPSSPRPLASGVPVTALDGEGCQADTELPDARMALSSISFRMYSRQRSGKPELSIETPAS